MCVWIRSLAFDMRWVTTTNHCVRIIQQHAATQMVIKAWTWTMFFLRCIGLLSISRISQIRNSTWVISSLISIVFLKKFKIITLTFIVYTWMTKHHLSPNLCKPLSNSFTPNILFWAQFSRIDTENNYLIKWQSVFLFSKIIHRIPFKFLLMKRFTQSIHLKNGD